MAKKWSAITHKSSPAQRAQVSARVQQALAEMPLQELRRARALTQTRLAETLEMTQPEVSKIEQRADLLISTLRSYIEAMGGDLEIVARFPDGSAVRVNQFHELDEEKDAAHV